MGKELITSGDAFIGADPMAMGWDLLSLFRKKKPQKYRDFLDAEIRQGQASGKEMASLVMVRDIGRGLISQNKSESDAALVAFRDLNLKAADGNPTATAMVRQIKKGYLANPSVDGDAFVGTDPMAMGWDLLSYFRKKKQAPPSLKMRAALASARPNYGGIEVPSHLTTDEKWYGLKTYRGLKRVQEIWPYLSTEEKKALTDQLDNPGPKGILPNFITTLKSVGEMSPIQTQEGNVYTNWSTQDFAQGKPWVMTKDGLRRVRRGEEASPLPLGAVAGATAIQPAAQKAASTAQRNVALALNSKDPKKVATARQTCVVLATAARNGSGKAAAHLRSIRNHYRQGVVSGMGDAFVGEDSIIGASLEAICGTSCYRKGL
jgi:hypothetical protein